MCHARRYAVMRPGTCEEPLNDDTACAKTGEGAQAEVVEQHVLDVARRRVFRRVTAIQRRTRPMESVHGGAESIAVHKHPAGGLEWQSPRRPRLHAPLAALHHVGVDHANEPRALSQPRSRRIGLVDLTVTPGKRANRAQLNEPRWLVSAEVQRPGRHQAVPVLEDQRRRYELRAGAFSDRSVGLYLDALRPDGHDAVRSAEPERTDDRTLRSRRPDHSEEVPRKDDRRIHATSDPGPWSVHRVVMPDSRPRRSLDPQLRWVTGTSLSKPGGTARRGADLCSVRRGAGPLFCS